MAAAFSGLPIFKKVPRTGLPYRARYDPGEAKVLREFGKVAERLRKSECIDVLADEPLI
jgi:hypothetical protein